MKGTNLGEFEELVLLITGVLYPEAYGAAIIAEIEAQTSRKPSVGALHSALNRLDEKGFIKSKTGESTESRRGRKKVYYFLTESGEQALVNARQLRNNLFNLIPNISDK
ncbi:PadR family transcriptional regulator [Fulvivirga lutimaris]|uniref:PadR family transcriptional regulator n=1 Tax=Fulvivirga lutimaris TaxID=1819566 RepID=UPI0012BCFA59|nr:PadR family transcriptional regulator [Fulvivirga lutimaris]MTI39040.1 PadR family transcriptional regulator [Fulvivirga lutimaris]